MIHGLMHLWKWLHSFQGIFHKLPPSCIYIVRSSMLGYEYLAGKTFWMLKMLHSPIEWYNTEQILMKLWQAFIQTILMSVSIMRHKKPNFTIEILHYLTFIYLYIFVSLFVFLFLCAFFCLITKLIEFTCWTAFSKSKLRY